ncbi:hypothetical protein ACG83_29080 [Frankia sp. R43]|uniref:hypothetical protein n=1 Tax=Frankia sp. R43 TaxID=269536 RepID=UPI0006C9F228|nr:hypothetical protein [Frankia sp. R43]KPM52423.1 hypothetical protein ACG83_29080 [Frankia sp. R43]
MSVEGVGDLAGLGDSAGLVEEGWAGPEGDFGTDEDSVGPEESDSQALADLLAGDSRDLNVPPEDTESPAAGTDAGTTEAFIDAQPTEASQLTETRQPTETPQRTETRHLTEGPPTGVHGGETEATDTPQDGEYDESVDGEADSSVVMSDSEALAESIAGDARGFLDDPDDPGADGPGADGPISADTATSTGVGEIDDVATPESDSDDAPVPEATQTEEPAEPTDGPTETRTGETLDNAADNQAAMSDSEALAESIAGDARAFLDSPDDPASEIAIDGRTAARERNTNEGTAENKSTADSDVAKATASEATLAETSPREAEPGIAPDGGQDGGEPARQAAETAEADLVFDVVTEAQPPSAEREAAEPVPGPEASGPHAEPEVSSPVAEPELPAELAAHEVPDPRSVQQEIPDVVREGEAINPRPIQEVPTAAPLEKADAEVQKPETSDGLVPEPTEADSNSRTETARDLAGKYIEGELTRDPASQWYHEHLSNEELLDSINNAPEGDGILVSRGGIVLGGHHRLDELMARVNDGRIDPDTRINVEIF